MGEAESKAPGALGICAEKCRKLNGRAYQPRAIWYEFECLEYRGKLGSQGARVTPSRSGHHESLMCGNSERAVAVESRRCDVISLNDSSASCALLQNRSRKVASSGGYFHGRANADVPFCRGILCSS